MSDDASYYTFPQPRPKLRIKYQPPPSTNSLPSSTSQPSKLRLAQVFHHGFINPNPSSLYKSAEHERSDKFFRVMDLKGPISTEEWKDEQEPFQLKGRKAYVPEWSKVSKASRIKEWEGKKGGRRGVWEEEAIVHLTHKETLEPDMSDPQTVLSLAKMTYNSYNEPTDKQWMPIPGYNVTDRFGWTSDGIRGYVFVDEENEVVVVAVKGTSLTTPIGGGPTSPRDKFNDNMMFSCCCGKAGWSWTPICDCATSSTTCTTSCLLTQSSFSDSYYNLANTIVVAVQSWYPKASSFWVTGHSLGGALAGLVALTHDLPGVAFEAPGEFMYAGRIGLLPDLPPSDSSLSKTILGGIGEGGGERGDAGPYDAFLDTLKMYHVGNTKDPIYLGVCQGPGSSCWYVGYALETRCHAGKECVYDPDAGDEHQQSPTKGGLKIQSDEEGGVFSVPYVNQPGKGRSSRLSMAKGFWSIDIRYHSIELMIKQVFEKWDHVPECKVNKGCKDCGSWEWV
ncbi:putative lipase atg15 [Chytridiales sp. JEL 0842]|nr:putative lipase atg15 [Chytridiales sp. JEL 0842]